MKKLLPLIMFITCTPLCMPAQLLKNVGDRIERKAKERLDRKIDQKIDEGLDELEGKNKNPRNKNTQSSEGTTVNEEQPSERSTNTDIAYLSKYDFIPGDKVIHIEDFSQDNTGDFPHRWNTNSSGEVVSISGSEGKWLAFTTKGAVTPESINRLPENFTLEFDLVASNKYSYYDAAFQFALAQTDGSAGFEAWEEYGSGKKNGILFELHPQDAGSSPSNGRAAYAVYKDGKKVMNNELSQSTAFSNTQNKAHIAIWRQKERVRLYVNQQKVWDLPKAFNPSAQYNSIVFSRHNANKDARYFIANIRLAEGSPDTRNKLVAEGRFSTSGIYFNTGSAVIKSESHGILKEIANTLKEHPSMNINIIGHTDTDGNTDMNRNLSAQRAESVKNYLNRQFGISSSRMSTEGKGASEPVGDNRTSEGKAQNRRVEFIKIN